MSRKSSRRTATSFARYYSPDSNSENEDMDQTLFQLMHSFMHSRKRPHKRNCKCANKKTNKKNSAKKSPAPTKKSALDVIELDDSRENMFSKTIRDNYQKDVEHRVDAFFKSANLLSEDEEDDKLFSSKPDIVKKTVVSKDMYILSDSDDDLPSTSVTNTKTSSYSHTTTSTNTIKESKTNKEDELMEIVDNILDSNDLPVETIVEVDNWNEFKSKTDEILGSVTAILGEEHDKLLPSKPDIGKNTVVSKDLYVLSDSDDDLPTSVAQTKTSSYLHNTTTTATTIEESKTNKEDDLMEIVENILDSNDIPVETISDIDNWNEFKSKTDEILGSVTAILGTMNDKPKEPSTSLEKEKEISMKNKRSCPICLEDLDENVVIGSTICGHIFCMECIKEAVKKTKSCPTCRKKITIKQIHRLYL